MDVNKALQILEQATGKITADRQTHAIISQALEAVRNFIDENTKECGKD